MLVKFQEVPFRSTGAIPLHCKSGKWGRRPACLNRELFVELKRKENLYGHWERGQASQEEYRDVVHM